MRRSIRESRLSFYDATTYENSFLAVDFTRRDSIRIDMSIVVLYGEEKSFCREKNRLIISGTVQ